MSKKSTVKIEFDNDEMANEFLTWLCEQGEQDYWLWMECQDDGQKSKVTFDYWKDGEKKGFCPNLTVLTKKYGMGH